MSIRLCAVLLVLGGTMLAQQAPVGYDDTPMQPNGKWRVHDGKRPQPTDRHARCGVTAMPAPLRRTPPCWSVTRADLSAWQMMDGAPVTWAMSNGVARNRQGPDPHARRSSPTFSCTSSSRRRRTSRATARAAATAASSCSASSRSRCWTAITTPPIPDGQASAMYGQYPPLVNASRPPGRMADVRHRRSRRRDSRPAEAGEAGRRHRPSQRHRRAQRHAVLGTDGAQEDRSVHAGQREGADRACRITATRCATGTSGSGR